jgi:hypothetical protein
LNAHAHAHAPAALALGHAFITSLLRITSNVSATLEALIGISAAMPPMKAAIPSTPAVLVPVSVETTIGPRWHKRLYACFLMKEETQVVVLAVVMTSACSKVSILVTMRFSAITLFFRANDNDIAYGSSYVVASPENLRNTDDHNDWFR